jgi:zinc/manganese transport system substrate-binding protein
VVTYVRNIAAGLTRADPAGAAYYGQRATAYTARLTELDGWAAQRIAQVPPAKRKVITSHDAFGYFAARYGITMVAVAGVSTNADAGARDMADIIRLIRRENVKALFLENIANPRLIEQIASETGAQVGGSLYSDALSATGGPAPTYLAMMRHNVETLVAGMQRN